MKILFPLLLISGCASEKSDTAEHDSENVDGYNYDLAVACHPEVEGWGGALTYTEFELLDAVNATRAQGANCGEFGDFAPAEPLEMHPNLHCAARYHSLWMANNGTLSHESPGGDLGSDPWERIESAGFPGLPIGENVAVGQPNPSQVMISWMNSGGHCANIMSPDANRFGAGYYVDGANPMVPYWTQKFGYRGAEN